MSSERSRNGYYPDYDSSIYVAHVEDPKKPSIWEKIKKPLGILAAGAVLGAGIGVLDGARRALTVDGGGITAGDTPAEAVIKEAAIEKLLCVAYAKSDVTLSRSYEMRPWGDFAANLGLYAKKTITGNKLPRMTDYCFEPQTFKYEFHPDRPLQRNGGQPSEKAITAEIDLESMVTIVSRPPDVRRDSYTETSAGAFAPLMTAASGLLQDKDIQNILRSVPGATNDPDPETQLENVMKGSLDADSDEIAAERCLDAGKDYDFSQPTIRDVIEDGAEQAILDAYREQFPDNPQPDADDIDMQIVEDSVKVGDGVQIKDGVDQGAKDSMRKVEEIPREVTIQVGPVPVKIQLNIPPVEAQPVNCVIQPGAIKSTGSNTQPTEEANR